LLAKRYVDDFPLSRAGLLEWSYIPVTAAPLPLEFVFDSRIDVAEPFDRTTQPVLTRRLKAIEVVGKLHKTRVHPRDHRPRFRLSP
jgi:hypothetical protein